MSVEPSTKYETLLRQSPVFSNLDDKVLKEMLKAFKPEIWGKGVRGLSSNTSKRFHVVISGRLELQRSHPDTGRTVTLWLLGPGDVFDVVTLLDGKPHDVTPMAIDEVEILYTSMANARRWLDIYPEFNKNFLPYVGEQFRRMENLATDFALHDTMTRLARLILRHVGPEHPIAKKNPPPLRLINDLSHEAIARLVGSVRVVVTRHLQYWKKLGVIDYQRGKLEIKDLEALADWCKDLLDKERFKGDK